RHTRSKRDWSSDVCSSDLKLMLHQTGQLAEFWNVSSQEIDAMHCSKDAAHFALPRQNCREDFAWAPRVLIRPGDLFEASAHQIRRLRTQIQDVFLDELERSHHLLRIFLEKIASIRMQLFIANKERPANRSFVRSY